MNDTYTMVCALFLAIALPIGLMQALDGKDSKNTSTSQRNIDRKNSAMQKSARNNNAAQAIANRQRPAAARATNAGSYTDIMREQNAVLNRELRTITNTGGNQRNHAANDNLPARQNRQLQQQPQVAPTRSMRQQGMTAPIQQPQRNTMNNINPTQPQPAARAVMPTTNRVQSALRGTRMQQNSFQQQRSNQQQRGTSYQLPRTSYQSTSYVRGANQR